MEAIEVVEHCHVEGVWWLCLPLCIRGHGGYHDSFADRSNDESARGSHGKRK